MRDVVLERRHRVEVERPDVGAAELVDLAERGQQPGAVAAQLALLPHHAELDREPEDVGEVLQRLGRLAAAGGLAGEPLDLGDLRVGEQVPVPDHLVHDVRLGRVERRARVAQVLRRVEDAVGERAVELVERDEPGGGVEREAGQRLRGRRSPRRAAGRGPRAARARPWRRGTRGRRGARAWARARGRRCARSRARPPCTPRAGSARRAPGQRGGGDLVAAAAVLGIVRAGVVVGQVDLDPVRALGHGCVELRLLEHARGRMRARRATTRRVRIVPHHGNYRTSGRPGSQDSCVAAAGWAPIVRRHRARRSASRRPRSSAASTGSRPPA